MMKTARTTIKIRFWMILEKSRREKKKKNTVKTVENILNNVKRYKDKYHGEKAQGHKFRFSNTILHILTVFTSFHFQYSTYLFMKLCNSTLGLKKE